MNNNEIDLFKVISDFYQMIRKKLLMIFLFILAGIVCGTLMYKKSASKNRMFYKKDYFVQSGIYSPEILSDIINDYRLKLENVSANAKLKSELHLTDATIESFRKIKVSLQENSQRIVLKFSVETFAPEYTDSIVNGIEKYILNNKYLQAQALSLKKQKLSLLNEINKWIEINNENIQSRKNDALNYILLVEKKQNLEHELSLFKAVDLIQINVTESMTKSGDRILYMICYGFFGALSGVLLSIIQTMISRKKSKIE